MENSKVPQDRDLTYVTKNNDYISQILKIPRDRWVVKGAQVRSLWKDRVEKGIQLTEIFPDLFSNLDYDTAIATAIMDFNSVPPMSGYTPITFPDPYFLLFQSFAEIIKIAIAYHANNYFTGNSGGISVAIHETFQSLQPLLGKIEQEMEGRKIRLKRRQSMIEAMGTTNHYDAWGFWSIP